MKFWYAGGVASVKWEGVQLLLAVGVIGLLLAFLIARSVTVLSLGEELKGLGQYTSLVKVIGMFVVVLLTGLQSQSPEPFLLSAW